MNSTARTLLTAALLLIAVPCVVLNDTSLRTQQMQRLDEPAPDFALRNVSATDLHLGALRGHPVVIHFWAWCMSCRDELPVIQAQAQQLNDTDVEFLTVAIDADSNTADINEFAANMGITLPVFLAADGKIIDRY